MRPFRSFLLLFIVLACLTCLSYVFPESRLFPSLSYFFPSQTRDRGLSQGPESGQSSVILQASDIIYTADSVTIKNSSDYIPYSKSLNHLDSFLDTLNTSKSQIRLLYYGDSQIEGDRITFYLRQLLRDGREGSGPGLFLPLMPVMYGKSLWLNSSSNWKRYNYISYSKGQLTHNRLGPLMTICRYLPEGKILTVPEKAFVRIRPSVFSDAAAADYDKLRIFYSNAVGRINVKVKADGNLIYSDSLRSGMNLQEMSCSLGHAKDVLIEFEGFTSPDIYGISIESDRGVIVDNIPRRGSTGLEFTLVDEDNLRESFIKLSPDLIILHYGLNLVRNVRSDYSYYRQGLARQLSLLRELTPSTPVLVVSVTDMAGTEGDTLSSYRNIPSIIKAQQEAALEAGAGFWNAYIAMGGRSSIIRWARLNPPLSQTDYVHLTYDGADTLSLMLVNAMFSSFKEDTLVRVERATMETMADSISSQDDGDLLTDKKSRTGLLISGVFRYDPEKPFIFTSPAFWIFSLLVLAGYSLIYRKRFLRNLYLLLASIFFYYKAGGVFLSLLIIVTLIDYICGLLIYRSEKKIIKKSFLLLSIISNLGILAYFKYTGFFVHVINEFFGTDLQVYDFLASFSNVHFGTSFNISNIILPVGISFFTFQSLSYIFDTYRGKVQAVTNIVDFGFYVSFFPQLVAGPIVRASEFIPQLYHEFNLSKREFSHALFLILKGLIKKMVISDFIAVNFVDRVFDLPALYSGFENLMAIYGYGLQIYCDFSGYTDIAIGLALILGFRLPLNFNSPYKAAGVSDFWRRWHISLSRWLKDYLYIPLGGNRKG
ncbi:MAG: hypothetical protein JXN62_13540, partial [Bacteroidales bacterium]|nr:hypothetical protein [Bacteroidales bacterium]